MRVVSQLSLFAADARPATVADLAGLLCGPGQIVRFGAGDTARLSIVLPDPSRADAVGAACAAVGAAVTAVRTASGATALRTAFRHDLVDLARAWTHGAAKSVPTGMQLDGRVLRLWALAAGRADEQGGFLLALDPHALDTHRALLDAATRAGLRPKPVRRGSALRISGARRVQRLVELLGPLPTGLAPDQWPRCRRRSTP